MPAITADAVTAMGGVGKFGLIELQKALAGKVVQVSPSIGELTEGFSGGSSPQDLETLFQLVYLYATQPRKDAEAFDSYRVRMKGIVEKREARPETVYEDRVNEIVTQEPPAPPAVHHGAARRARPRPFALDLRRSLRRPRRRHLHLRRRLRSRQDRAAGAHLPRATCRRPAARRPSATSASCRRAAWWSSASTAGLEEKSQVRILWSGDFEWSRANRYDLASMSQALSIRLREALREELGGTYGVSAGASTTLYPKPEYDFMVAFGCAPDRVDELVARVFAEIKKLKDEGVPDDLLAKIKETQRRERETDLKENGFWLQTLRFYDFNHEDPSQILDLEKWIAALDSTAIRNAARKYLDEQNYVQVALLPERMAPASAAR